MTDTAQTTTTAPAGMQSLGDAISDAWSTLEELALEMREWAENLEEKFSSTDKYSRVCEAADVLEGLHEPDWIDGATPIWVPFFALKKKRPSRSDRRDHATSILDAAIQAVQDRLDALDEASEQRGPLEDIIGELEELKDEAEAVEFVGAFG